MATRAIPTPFTTQGYDPEYLTAIKGFEKVALNSAKKVKDFVPLVYKPKTFTERTIKYPVYSGIPDAVACDGLGEITPQGMNYLYEVSATQSTYANSVEYTYDSELWDVYGINTHKAEELGKTGPSKYQRLAMQPLIDGFSTAWFDSVNFFGAHTLLDGTTQTNLATGALSHDTLMDAMIAGMNMYDPYGRHIEQEPDTLFVHTTKVPLAEYLINRGNKLMSGTANNDNNAFPALKVVGVPYFTATMWVLKFTNAEAYVSNRVPIKLFPSRENDAHGFKQDLTFTCAFWFENYIQWIGSTGL